MLSRCEDEDNPQYKDYGGRGISVCSEWHDFDKFYQWCVSNNFSPELQLDRTNNDGNYEPKNCQFVTGAQNSRNKRNNRIITAFGETKTLVDWSEDPRCSVSRYTLMQRILRGWDHEMALSSASNETRAGKIPHNAAIITAWGESKIVSEWLEDDRCLYKKPQGIWERINKFNWPPEKAMSQLPGKGRPKKSV